MHRTRPGQTVIIMAAEHFANFFMNDMTAYAIYAIGMGDSYETLAERLDEAARSRTWIDFRSNVRA
jgi:hypothetical protein